MLDIVHIILAAGQGTRLYPLSQNLPKAMVPLIGKPLIEHQLEVIQSHHINNIVIATGYQSDKFNIYPFKKIYNPDFTTTNMVHSLNLTKEEFKEKTIISYGDIIYSNSVYETLLNSDANISVVVDLGWLEYWQERFSNPLNDAETLKLDLQKGITEIGKKTTHYSDIQAQYIGLMKFQGNGVEILKNVLKNYPPHMYMTDLLQKIIDYGFKVQAITVYRNWFEIDNLHDLSIAETKMQKVEA